MGKSKDLATGASYVDTAGDTMTGALTVSGSNGELLNVSSTSGSELAVYVDGNEISFRADADNNNNDSVMTFDLDGSEKMRIDGSGRVTMPSQPSFHARRTGGHGTTGTIIFNTADVNVGNHYSTSTGNFTAPIAGRYLLYTTVLSASGTNVGADMKINGTRYAVTEESWANQSSTYRSTSITAIASLAANDAVRVDNKQGGYYGSSSYTFFGGYLLG